jgi:hypothetical protein
MANPTTFSSRDSAGIFDGNGNFDANAYVTAAKAYGTPAMINRSNPRRLPFLIVQR